MVEHWNNGIGNFYGARFFRNPDSPYRRYHRYPRIPTHRPLCRTPANDRARSGAGRTRNRVRSSNVSDPTRLEPVPLPACGFCTNLDAGFRPKGWRPSPSGRSKQTVSPIALRWSKFIRVFFSGVLKLLVLTGQQITSRPFAPISEPGSRIHLRYRQTISGMLWFPPQEWAGSPSKDRWHGRYPPVQLSTRDGYSGCQCRHQHRDPVPSRDSVHVTPNHGVWLNPVPNPLPTVASGSMCRLIQYLLQDLFAGTESKRSSQPHKLVSQHPGCQSQTPVILTGAQCRVLPRTRRHYLGNRSSVAFLAMSDNCTYQT